MKNVKTSNRTDHKIDLLKKTFVTDIYKALCFSPDYDSEGKTIIDECMFYCNYCGECINQPVGAGVTNLRRHFATHDDCIEWIREQIKAKRITKYFVVAEPRDQDIYGWIRLIVMKNLPLSAVEDEEYRLQSKYGRISIKTLLKYMHLLGEEVRKEIVEKLDKFGLLFDGWDDHNGTHYCGIFAIVPTNDYLGFELLLLAMSPFEDESNFTGDNYITFINQTLGQYEIDLNNVKKRVLFLVGDNCTTNVSISTKMNIPLIGCYSHRLNLACKQIFTAEKHLIDKVDELMKKLSNNKPRGFLRIKLGAQDLAPVRRLIC